MRKVNLNNITPRQLQSPKGKFGVALKEISIALGRERDSFEVTKRHPFDLTLARIAPNKSLCPYHSHSSESELYLVLSGEGSVRDKGGVTKVTAGDAFFFGPGEAHKLTNTGSEDLVYYVIADNPIGDTCFYPDSGKFAVCKEGAEQAVVRAEEVDYFEGEE